MIGPALTAEEWAKSGSVDVVESSYETGRHAMAALCLYGQEFGFTREDVEWLRLMALDMADLRAPMNVKACNHLADRIEALLPPENDATDSSSRVMPPEEG